MTALAPARALLWEYYRIARRPVLLVTLASCALALLYHAALEPLGPRRDAVVFTAFFTTLLIVVVLTLVTCRSEDSSSQGSLLGFERRLYRLPLGTTRLALGRLLPAVVAAAAMYAGVALFVALVLDTRWPLLGPLLVTVVVLVWAQALNWWVGRLPFLLAPLGLPLLVLLSWWLRPWLRPGADLLGVWQGFGAREAAMLAASSLVGAALAVLGVHVDRSLPEGTRTLATLLRRRADRARVPDRAEAPTAASSPGSFRSAVDAQLWLEWREKGRWLTLLTVVALWFHVLGSGFPEFTTAALLQGAALSCGFQLLAAPIMAGFLHARFDLSSSVATIDRLRATRPLDDRQLAWTLLRAAYRTVLAAWGSLAVSVALLVGLLVLRGDGGALQTSLAPLRPFLDTLGPLDIGLAVVVVLAWGFVSSGALASLVLAGRNWVVGTFAAAPLALLVVAVMLERITGIDAWRRLLLPAAFVVIAILPVLTVLCAVLAWRRGLVSPRRLFPALACWGAVSALLFLRFPLWSQAFGGRETLLERALALTAPAAATAIVLPLVAAPLMLAWNRHR